MSKKKPIPAAPEITVHDPYSLPPGFNNVPAGPPLSRRDHDRIKEGMNALFRKGFVEEDKDDKGKPSHGQR